MRKIVLDTNAFVRYLAGDEKVLAALAAAERVFMSVIVLGELNAGFRASRKATENRRLLERFLEKPSVAVLEASKETAEIFGEVKDALRREGRPIPIHDIWIAAHALETGSILLTYDAHFQAVPGLRMWEAV